MIKDLIVNLGLGAHDPAGDFAITVADVFEAHVLGLAFSYEPVVPGSVMGGIPVEFIESQRTEADKLANNAVSRFEAAAKRAGVSAETRIISTSISGAADQFGHMARRFDIVVVGQPEGDKSVPDEVVDEGVLFESGRPVIFVPFIATRAIADSMPLLKKAKEVEIVMVATKGFKTDEAPGADLAKHLARHALDVNLKRITSPDIDIASTVLSYAADSNADFIVMGGYGHSRLREFILGGATRGILESMTVPVLMSH